jgi:hypothetical protein
MRPLFLDHELVMMSNQLTFHVQKRRARRLLVSPDVRAPGLFV